ncbi:MAG: hypothetical protein SPL47_10840 [Bacteroidales bacterium]|nr:hypothetical protein [Bacteroidales bacterium]
MKITTKSVLTAILLMFSFHGAFAQTRIGDFTVHSNLHSFHSVACDDHTVYAASANSIMLLDKETADTDSPELSYWSKVEGLSDIDIVGIFSFEAEKTLMVAYENGNLDFVKGDRIINVCDIKDKSISSSKTLQMCREIDGKAYLVYPFGIVVFDLEELVISDTWFTKRDGRQYLPTDITHDSEKWYMTTTDGVFASSCNSQTLFDFSSWRRVSDASALFVASVDGMVYICKHNFEVFEDDTLLVIAEDGLRQTGKVYRSVRGINVYGDSMLVCNWDFAELLDSRLERVSLVSWYDNSAYPDARGAVLDGSDIWVADKVYGLVRNNLEYYFHRRFTRPSIFTDYVERMSSHNGIVAAVHGTRKGSTSFAPGYRFPALSLFSGNSWSYNASDFLNYDSVRSTYDLTDVAINPFDETELYVASWGNGLFKYKNNRVVAHYNAKNSPLDSTQYGQVFVSGLQFDNKGNLWMTNSQSPTMLKVLAKTGEWHSYNIGTGVIASSPEGVVAENLVIDSHGFKWVNFPRDGAVNRYSLVAFSDNGTLDNTGDDKFARIDMNAAAEVGSSRVYCIAADLDGEIWIGTDKGVKVIYSPGRVFTSATYPRNILLEQDGYVSVLLENEEVTAIAVDGANRKWIGTGKAGVFLMSENGQEELLHFTAADSPLFSDQIVSINVNHLTGEVFFATSKGLVSYRGTATSGAESYSDLLVFPNPVPHDYAGVVAVKGLKENSLCKITDSSGRLVWQGYSHGGQLVWDCKDHFGNRPATGVYYVMASDEDGKDKVVTKFVFVN